MKRRFQDVEIQCWEHRGLGQKMGRERPAICLQAAPSACEVLLAAVEELLADEPPAQRVITLKACHRKRACAKLRLRLSPPSDELLQMCLTCEQTVATLEFTPAALAEFREAIACWRDGGEDFGISPDITRRTPAQVKDRASQEVWFWTPRMEP